MCRIDASSSLTPFEPGGSGRSVGDTRVRPEVIENEVSSIKVSKSLLLVGIMSLAVKESCVGMSHNERESAVGVNLLRRCGEDRAKTPEGELYRYHVAVRSRHPALL